MYDNLVECKRCGSHLAYKREINENISSISCLTCGFQTVIPLMRKGEKYFEEQMELLPNLYKELMEEDEDGNIWYPSYYDSDGGMIFANGTGKDNWKWNAIKKIDIPLKEQKKYPNPNKPGEFYKRKTDTKTLKEFNETEYALALEYLGALK